MRNISFAWTTPALLAGRKTVTRREWNDDYARSFREGDLVAAYDRQPRFKGKQIGVIRLTEKPCFTDALPEQDWEGEGFEYLTSIGATVNKFTPRQMWESWRTERPKLWVVRFEVVELTPESTKEG